MISEGRIFEFKLYSLTFCTWIVGENIFMFVYYYVNGNMIKYVLTNKISLTIEKYRFAAKAAWRGSMALSEVCYNGVQDGFDPPSQHIIPYHWFK